MDNMINMQTPKNFLFVDVFNRLIHFRHGSEYTFILIYIITFSLLIFKLIYKKFNNLDLAILFSYVFFFIIYKNPEARVHTGLVFFHMFYIFENIPQNINKIKYYNNFKYILFFITIFVIFNTKIDSKYYDDTKKSVDKINNYVKIYNCKELNSELNNYEIWILKNVYPEKCGFLYDPDLKINILF